MRESTQSAGDDDLVADAVEVFRLLADETRVRLLCRLLDAELSVGELAERVQRPIPAVSQHLARLRRARAVATRREGNHIYYRIANDHISQLVIDALRHSEHGRGGVPRHHRQETPAARAEATGPTG